MEQSISYSKMQSILKKNNRLDALLALRGFACLMVVIIHCALQEIQLFIKVMT